MNLETLVIPLKMDEKGFHLTIKSSTAAIMALVAGIGIAVKATFDWANDLDALGDVMDGTNKDFAALAFVARKSGVGVEAVTKANTMLNKSLFKVDGALDTTGIALEAYGIDVKYANGNVKDSIQLTDEIAKKYAKLSTAQERVNFLTEIYGKSGAQMVDFFDTLVADGGIDAVRKKVEALGLAIDPSRYEQFNRNLEELKLVGLGLAVSFTEKIMPAIEGFLGILNKVAQSPKFSEIKNKIKNLFNALFGGEEGGGDKFSLKNNPRMKSLDAQLAEIINGIDWKSLGRLFGEKIDMAFAVAIDETEFPQTKKALVDAVGGLSEAMREAAGWGANQSQIEGWLKTKEAIDSNTSSVERWKQTAESIEQVTTNNISQTDRWKSNWEGFTNWIDTIFTPKARTSATKAGQEMPKAVSVGFDQNVFMFLNSINSFSNKIEDKLREIGKAFFNRGMGWTQQAVKGFQSGIRNVIDAIEDIVDEINGILKKIKTHFAITFSFGTQSAGTSGTSSLGGTSGSGARGGRGKGRDVLGAVPAGQFNDKPVVARISREDMRDMVRMLSEEIAKAAG